MHLSFRRKPLIYLYISPTIQVMEKYIISDPNIMGGTPVIKGTRVPIEVILHRLKEGNSIAAIHEMYSWVDILKCCLKSLPSS